MAIIKTIEIKADSKDAVKGIEKVTDALEGVEGQAEDAEDAIDKVGKTAKEQGKAVKGLGKSVKVVGLALKALGIGLIIALVAKMTEVFSRNQKVLDFFSTAMEVLSIAFNDLFNFVSKNFSTFTGFFKQLFEDPLGNLKEFGRLIQENIIERFESALEVIGFLSVAFKKLFEGDFKGALETAKLAGIEFIDVLTGVDDTLAKVSESIDNIIESGSEYLSQTLEQARANVQLANTAQLAAASQSRLVEQFDRLAEKQRQIRDDESKSIKDRQEANERLGKILEDQEQSMIKLADLQVAAAQAVLNTNNNIENQVALIDALANKEGILAQVEGFRSEQIVNRIALQKEEIQLNQTITDAERQRQLDQLAFQESQLETEAGKLEKLRESLELENEIIFEDLERKRELFAEGTQARIDAEQDFLTRKQDIDNQIVDNERKANDLKEDDEERLKNAKIAIGNSTLSVLGSLAKEGSNLAKGIAASQATINTFQGVTAALSAVSVIPDPFGAILKFANAAAIGIAGAINVKKILSTKPVTTSAPAGGGGGSAPPAPSFNLVEGTEGNQINDSLQGINEQPVQAFVVSTDVSTSQELDRNIVDGSGL